MILVYCYLAAPAAHPQFILENSYIAQLESESIEIYFILIWGQFNPETAVKDP